LQVQVPETFDVVKDIVDIVVEEINKDKDEEFVTVKGEFENKSVEEIEDMEIKELLEKMAETMLAVSLKLDKLGDLEKLTGLVDDMTEIKSFITNLTKSTESDITEGEVDNKSVATAEAEDLYKETLSQTDNKETPTEEKANGLSPEEEEILKQVTLNLKNLFEKE
jgi:hypothetical protein